MPMEKMATFQEMSEDDFRNALLCFKHKMRNMVWTKGTSGLQGDFQSDSEVGLRSAPNEMYGSVWKFSESMIKTSDFPVFR